MTESWRDSIVSNRDLVEARCRYCKKWLSSKSSRDTHEDKHHLEEEKQYATLFRAPEPDEEGIKEKITLAEYVQL